MRIVPEKAAQFLIGFSGIFHFVNCDPVEYFLILSGAGLLTQDAVFFGFRFCKGVRTPSHFSCWHCVFVCCRRNPSIWSWVWLKAIIMASMHLPHRPKPLPSPGGGVGCRGGDKASFITLPSLPLLSLTPLEHYPFPGLFWCVNECIENLQAPKEMLSMKMRQSESTRVHTAHHSLQTDSNQTPGALLPSRLSETQTHGKSHRHKHSHTEVKDRIWLFLATLLLKWKFSVVSEQMQQLKYFCSIHKVSVHRLKACGRVAQCLRRNTCFFSFHSKWRVTLSTLTVYINQCSNR